MEIPMRLALTLIALATLTACNGVPFVPII
jgi:hypothetical protein